MGNKPSAEQHTDEDVKQPDLESGGLMEEKKQTDPRTKKGGKLDEGESLEKKMASMTPSRLLQYGALEGNKDIVRQAREAGGDVNTPDTGPVLKEGEKPSNDAYANIITGNYPLHMAAENGHTEMITLLFHFEANLENKNKIGSTALHTAVSHGHLEAVKELLKLGAKIGALNNMGNTPVHLAAYTGNVEIMEVLLKNGGTRFIHSKNKVEMTPVDYARKKQMGDLLTNASVQAGHPLSVPKPISENDDDKEGDEKSPTWDLDKKSPTYGDDAGRTTTPAELRASVENLKQSLQIDETHHATRTTRKKSQEMDNITGSVASSANSVGVLDTRAMSASEIQVVFHTSPSSNPISP